MNIIKSLILLVALFCGVSCKQDHGFRRPDLTSEQAANEVLSYSREPLSVETLQRISEYEVYYSLTTSPERLVTELPFVLKTLIANTGMPGVPHKIFIAIPYHYKNKEDGVYDESKIAEIKEMDPRIQILRIPKDLGPASKLVPAVDYIKKHMDGDPAKKVVLTFDDDFVYSPALQAQLVKQIIFSGNSTVVGGCGQDSDFWGINTFPGRRRHDIRCRSASVSNCDVVEGFHGVAYPAHLVDTVKIASFVPETNKPCRLSDDLVISFVLAKKGIPRVRIANQYTKGIIALEGGFKPGAALHLQNPEGDTAHSDQNASKYRRCYKDTLSKFHD